MKFYFGHYGQNFEHFSSYRRVNCNIERTMVPNAKKTAVLVLMPGLLDRSWSRTVPTIPTTRGDIRGEETLSRDTSLLLFQPIRIYYN